MNADKYQIKKKANHLKLLLLKDDLKYFHEMMQLEVKDDDSWIAKLRNTRHVFILLNNVRETVNSINLKGPKEYISQTRQLRKTLSFINHFRNKAVGHLDTTLLERAVQWSPSLFSMDNKNNEKIQIIQGQIAVIEASINSFLNEEGVQKVFKTEIDLMYPPDFRMFFGYLWKVVTESIDWLSSSLSIISSEIKFYEQDEMREISAVAGQTEFNLKKESRCDFNEAELRNAFKNVASKLEELGVKKEIIDFIEKLNS